MKQRTIIFLSFIILLGFVLRVWNLGNNPPGFFSDEASIGFNAYKILCCGVDEHGISFPFFFQAFGEYKNPVQIYSTVPFIFFLGVNEFAVRLVSAFYGAASILLIFLLSRRLFEKERNALSIGLIAAFLLAISPWHIHMSRLAMEGIAAFTFFTLLAVWSFLKSIAQPRWLFLSVTAFSLAVYSYFPARLFIPLFVLLLCLVYRKRFFTKQRGENILFALVLAMILSLPVVFTMLQGSGISRWEQVSIFAHPPEEGTVLTHIIDNYLSHFSLSFLFLKGDAGMEGQFITRHSVPGFGQLYLFQLPLIILALTLLVIKKRFQQCALLVGWLLLYPLGSMFTLDASAQATRSVIGVIPFQILSAFGLAFLVSLIHRRRFILRIFLYIALLTPIIFSSFLYVQSYATTYQHVAADFWGWQYGPKKIMEYFLAHKNEYDDLYLSGEFNGSHIFLQFYDPTGLCKEKCKLGDFYRDEIYNPNRKQLFSLSPDYLNKSEFSERFSIQETVHYPNGTVAFVIGTVVE